MARSALTRTADEISAPPSLANTSRMSASRSSSREASSFLVLIISHIDGYGAGRAARRTAPGRVPLGTRQGRWLASRERHYLKRQCGPVARSSREGREERVSIQRGTGW